MLLTLSHLRTVALVGFGLLLSLYLGHSLLFRTEFSFMHGDQGDVRFVHYCLEHGYQWLIRAPAHLNFWKAPFFYPEANTMAMSDVLVGSALPYWLARFAGLNSGDALATWVLSITGLNFLSMWLFLRIVFERSNFASIIGAVLFATGSSRINQLNHLQLLGHFWPLIGLLLLAVAIKSPSKIQRFMGISLSALCLAMQFYSSFYWGWFAVFLILVALILGMTAHDWRSKLLIFTKSHIGPWVTAALLFSIVMWPLAAHYLEAARDLGTRSYDSIKGMLPRFESWFHVGDTHWLYGFSARFFRISMEGEQRLGLGLLTPLVVIATFWAHRQHRALRFVAILTLTVMLLTTLYPFGISPWKAVFHVLPGANAIRAVSRIGLWLLIPAAMALALAIDETLKKKRFALAFSLGAFGIFEQGHKQDGFSVAQSRNDIDILKGSIPSTCSSFFYAPIEGAEPEYKYNLDAMWASLESRIPTVNGYSGHTPRGWNLEAPAEKSALAAWASLHAMKETPCWISYRPNR